MVRRERLKHNDRERLRESLRAWPTGTPVILEATFGWGWLTDELLGCGQDPHLANSRKVAGWRKALGMAKSDRTDAELLATLWGDQRRWWEVWLAPPEVRRRRELAVYRTGLVDMQTQLKNRVHATLHRHGVYHDFSDLFGAGGRSFLESLTTSDEAILPDSTRMILKECLAMLRDLRGRIAVVTRRFRREGRQLPEVRRLMSLPGVSTVLGYLIAAEIGDIARFRSGRHLASYCLLAPRSKDTGDCDEDRDRDGESPKGRHVGFVGRRLLKWAWIQAAHGAVRKGGYFRDIFDRRTNGGKRDRNRGYIAVAHVMCLRSYVMWKNDVNYTESPPPRPGSEGAGGRRRRRRGRRSKRRTSRPGTGQPDPTLAAAAVTGRLQASR